MEPVQQKVLLTVVHLAVVVSRDGVEPCVQAAECLVALLQDVIGSFRRQSTVPQRSS